MIQVNNLSVFYKSKKEGTHALGPISFIAHSDDICAIIGPSGCGKSTLLNVLSGIINTYEGEVLLNKEKLNPHIHKMFHLQRNQDISYKILYFLNCHKSADILLI